jgi:hypothetical protein
LTKIYSFVVISYLISGCIAPDPTIDLSPQDKDLYITNRDLSVNFANYKTYAIVDSVIVITKNPNDTMKNKSTYSNEIISDVNFEMQNDGFVKVGKSQNPDVGINVEVLKFSEKVPVSYFGYSIPGLGYYGYPSPAFWGYPGYVYGFPSYYQYYQIDVGSIAIEMIDLKNVTSNSENKLHVVWSALIAGSITDSTSVNNQRIKDAIKGSFDQSTYLREGK